MEDQKARQRTNAQTKVEFNAENRAKHTETIKIATDG